MNRAWRVPTLVVGGLLAIVACSGDDAAPATTEPQPTDEPAPSTSTSPTSTDPPLTTAPTTTTTEEPVGTAPAPTEKPIVMTITVDLVPEAVWQDGSPITVADFECTWRANLNTPGSIGVGGYDGIVRVEAGDSARQVVISFSSCTPPTRTCSAR